MYYYKAILPLGTASRKCSHSTLTNGLSLKPGHRRCPGSAAYQSLHTRAGVLRIALPVGFPAYHGTVSSTTSTGSHTVVRPLRYGTSWDTNPGHRRCPGRPHMKLLALRHPAVLHVNSYPVLWVLFPLEQTSQDRGRGICCARSM